MFLNHVVWGPDGNGVPIEIVSDRDSKFTPPNSKSKDTGFWRDFFTYIGTSIVLSTARHQRTDGQTERMIQHLIEVLRIGVDYEQSNWASLLPKSRIIGSTSGIHLDILRALGLRPPRSRMSVEVGGPDSTLV